jgi:hypothetical protein
MLYDNRHALTPLRTAPAMSDTPNIPPLCIACKQPIERGATLCQKCSSYQTKWRNEIKYWSGIAGLLTLIATGIAFAGNNVLLLYDRLSPPDLLVSEFNSFGKTALWNGSRQNVWVTHLQVKSNKPYFDVEWPIYTTIKSNTPLVQDMIDESAKSIFGSNREIFAKRPGDYAVQPDKDLISMIEGNNNDVMKQFVPAFLDADGTDYRQIEQNHPTRYEFSCVADLEYIYTSSISIFGSRNSAKNLSIPCVGMMRHRGS